MSRSCSARFSHRVQGRSGKMTGYRLVNSVSQTLSLGGQRLLPPTGVGRVTRNASLARLTPTGPNVRRPPTRTPDLVAALRERPLESRLISSSASLPSHALPRAASSSVHTREPRRPQRVLIIQVPAL